MLNNVSFVRKLAIEMYLKCALWLFILVVLIDFEIVQSRKNHYKKHRHHHAYKVSKHELNTSKARVKRDIVRIHNHFRSKVKPSASNMLKTFWNNEAAKQAQKYAEKCVFMKHNAATERIVPKYGSCGQNLHFSSQKNTWYEAIAGWNSEYKLFKYGSPNMDLLAVGHYTQLAWATTHQIGCGMAHCSGGPWGSFYNYVCHYCPAGNINIQYPYKVGRRCKDCPHSCSKEKLCTNTCHATNKSNNCAKNYPWK